MADAWDVIVVGAGPAGAMTASLLARLGYRALLLDRAHFPRPKACAEYMSPGVRDVLERNGLGQAVSAESLAVQGMEIISAGGRTLRLTYRQGDRLLSASTLQRARLDTILLENATKAGAVLEEGVTVKRPVREDSMVRGVVVSRSGREKRIPARLTIIADGSRSAMARGLGVGAAPRWPVRLGLMAHWDGAGNLRGGFGQMHVAAGGYCGIAPLPGGQLNVAVVVPPLALKESGTSATRFFEKWIATHPGLAEALGAGRRASPVRGVSPIGSRAQHVAIPGALLVGDAAGFFDPFTGEGIYRALRGAELAADVGGRALDLGDMSFPVLRQYTRDRQRAFRGKDAVTALVQIFVQWPALMEYALPRLARRDGPAGALSAVLGDIAPAGAFLSPSMLWGALRP